MCPRSIDTAADRTLIPDAIVQALALPQIGTIPIGGVGGVAQTMASYPVQLVVHNFPVQVIEVVASAGETFHEVEPRRNLLPSLPEDDLS